MQEIKVNELLDLEHTIAKRFFEKVEYPFEILPMLEQIILSIGKELDENEFACYEKNVWIHKSVKLAKGVTIESPCIIGEGSVLRQGAFLRGRVIIGASCVVGNSCEIKNSILFDGVAVPHFNYVGDCVLGYKSHLGAGVITSNVRSDNRLVNVNVGEMKLETGLRKLGAILGDFVEIGCNAVLNPGTIIGRNSEVQPLSSVRAFVAKNSIHKKSGDVVAKR